MKVEGSVKAFWKFINDVSMDVVNFDLAVLSFDVYFAFGKGLSVDSQDATMASNLYNGNVPLLLVIFEHACEYK